MALRRAFRRRLHQREAGGVCNLAAKYVEPESVSQLVGVDKNGREVYEEDKVQRLETGAVFRACFSDYDGILDGEIVKV